MGFIRIKMFIVLSIISLCSCRRGIEDHDNTPDWLKGNACQLLESKQNFTMFLQAAELVGYKPLLNGAGLCTVFAPDDEAFAAWLKANNYTSVEDVYTKEPKKLKILIGYHLVEQAFSRSQLLGFQMNNKPGVVVTDDGLCYKYKSYAKEEPTVMYDPVSRKEVTVYHREKYLPVISTRLYRTRKCSNYEEIHRYFFPDVNWQGDDDKIYVCNAAIKEVGLPTDNGYVYVLDKVVDPLRTLSDALLDPNDADANFSTFFKLMDRFSTFYYDKTISDKFAQPGEKYYLQYHNAQPRSRDKGVDLPEMASEWSYHGQEDNARPSYNRYLSDCYNCFAFSNDAFETFAGRYFPSEFLENFSEIPDITLYYLLLAHAYDHQQIMLPNQIDEKGVNGQMGENWNITTKNIVYREFCANGILYGIDSVFTPTVFDIITKPLFTSSKYSIVANMFRISNEFVTIIDREPKHYTLFVQSDESLENKYDLRVNYKNAEFGDEVVEYRKADGAMADYASTTHVQSHIIYGYVDDFKKPAYYGSKYPFTYIFVKNDTVYSEDRVGHTVVGDAGVESVNGITYEIDGKFGKNDKNLASMFTQSEYLLFYQKLMESGLLKLKNSIPEIEMLTSGERFVVMVPNDDALRNAPTDSTDLVDYLRYCFVPINVNQLSDYVLPGFGEHNVLSLQSYKVDRQNSTSVKTVYSPIQLDNVGPNAEYIRVIGENGEEIVSDGNMPRFATNGVIYKMTGGFTVNN